MKVPRHLSSGDTWLFQDDNNRDLRLFLSAHSVDINETFQIEFGARSMTVHRYDTPRTGTQNGEIREQPVARIKYRSGLVPVIL